MQCRDRKGDGDYEIWGEITVRMAARAMLQEVLQAQLLVCSMPSRMMRSLGLSDVEISRMAAANPARLLRIDNEWIGGNG